MTSWPYNDQPAGFALPSTGLGAEEHERLTEVVWASLILGHDDVDDFLDAEQGEWEVGDDVLRSAFLFARQARLDQQALWTEEQTTTNLDRAFTELNDAGILARQNFSCCGNCGATEISDERDDSRHWRGYVFFHQQDTEGLLEDGETYLGYGAFAPEDFDWDAYELMSEAEKEEHYRADLDRVIRDDAIPRLRSHGLTVDWNGDQGTRILVGGAQWYIRLDA